MDGAHAPLRSRGERDVGGLAGHADDHGEVQEVPVVGVVLAGEVQAAAQAVLRFAFGRRRGVVLVGVVQGEDDVHEQP